MENLNRKTFCKECLQNRIWFCMSYTQEKEEARQEKGQPRSKQKMNGEAKKQGG